MPVTDFADLLAFVESRDSRMREALVGVPEAEIREIEREIGVVLPELYVAFLASMGQSAGGFHPFGTGREHRFHDLLVELAEEIADGEQPSRRYFRISINTDPSVIIACDDYLDLRRSDGRNAPVVMFEQGSDLRDEDVMDKHEGFFEHLTVRLFRHLELEKRESIANVAIPGLTQREAPSVIRQLIELGGRAGVQPVFEPFEDLICLSSDDTSLSGQWDAGLRLVSVDVASDSGSSFRVLVDQLLRQWPDAVVSMPRS